MRSVNLGLVAAALFLGTTALTTPAFATGNHNDDDNDNGGDVNVCTDNSCKATVGNVTGGSVGNITNTNTANGGTGGQGGQGGQGGYATGGTGYGGNATNNNKNEANNNNAPVAHGGEGGEGGKAYGGNATGGSAYNNGNGNGNGNGNLKDVGNVSHSGNSYNDNRDTNNNTDINHNKNEQDQDQKQKQQQQQQQKQTIKDSGNSEIKNSGNSEIKNSGNSYSSNKNQNDNSNSNNADQEVNVNTYNERAPVNTAYAAPLAVGEDTCMGSSSIGAQAVSFGLSIGTTWQDDNCRRLKNSRQMVALGYHRAATALMCVDADVEAAMTRAGTPCPNGAVVAAAPIYYQEAAPARDYAPMAPVVDQPVHKKRRVRKPLPPK